MKVSTALSATKSVVLSQELTFTKPFFFIIIRLQPFLFSQKELKTYGRKNMWKTLEAKSGSRTLLHKIHEGHNTCDLPFFDEVFMLHRKL